LYLESDDDKEGKKEEMIIEEKNWIKKNGKQFRISIFGNGRVAIT